MDIFQFENYIFEITKGLVLVKKDEQTIAEFLFQENEYNTLDIQISDNQRIDLFSRGVNKEKTAGSILADLAISLVELENNEPIYADIIYTIDFKKDADTIFDHRGISTSQNLVTDFQKTSQLFSGFGIEFKVEEKDRGKRIVLETHTEKVEGYMGFQSEYVFDENEDFVKIGIWE
ncbi:hypothetical protein ACFVS2_21085 [Brevibacillus sp. NPDC058079]|uniref:hypothetical protein n=1 Tax=Brevibacillus sp. NPDC058079 TaxID=3346330 RepID=UPI0036F0D054